MEPQILGFEVALEKPKTSFLKVLKPLWRCPMKPINYHPLNRK